MASKRPKSAPAPKERGLFARMFRWGLVLGGVLLVGLLSAIGCAAIIATR